MRVIKVMYVLHILMSLCVNRHPQSYCTCICSIRLFFVSRVCTHSMRTRIFWRSKQGRISWRNEASKRALVLLGRQKPVNIYIFIIIDYSSPGEILDAGVELCARGGDGGLLRGFLLGCVHSEPFASGCLVQRHMCLGRPSCLF